MKKINFLLLIIALLVYKINFAQVGIGTTTPHPSSKLDITSTSSGLLIPRMTTVQRTAIGSPALGLQVFDTDTKGFWFYNGVAWTDAAATAGGAFNWTLNGTNIYNNNAGNVGIGLNIPLAPLHIKKDNEAIRIQGATPYISFYDNAGMLKGFVQNFNNNMLFGTPSSNPNSKLEFYNGNIKNMTIDGFGGMDLDGSIPFLSLNYNGTRSGYLYGKGIDMEIAAHKSGTAAAAGNLILQANEAGYPGTIYSGNVGIGVTDPAYKLDIGTRIRLRSGSTAQTAGIWMNNPANTASIAFMGIADVVTTGFYGNVSGWGLIMNTNTGNVGIGTLNPTYKLSVNGDIRTKEVVVETGWADYVFDKGYRLTSLDELEKFIQTNKHLPNIPSASEIEKNGLHVGDTQKKMMEKIEELTLYVIELKKELTEIKKNHR